MIQFFVRHPNASNLLMIASCILGLSVITGMERESLPEFNPSRVSVSVLYPGASAVDVDEEICQELDSSLSNISDLDELECQSTEGRANATLTMADGGDISQFFNDTLSEVSALNGLPTDAEEPTVAVAARDDLIGLIAISGIEGADSLLRYTDGLAAQLGHLSMVSDARVTGIGNQEYRVTFDALALRQFGLSARDVSDAIAARSLRQPLGTVRTSDQDFSLRYADIRRSVDELESLVLLRNDGGGVVRLSDIGTVALVSGQPELQSFIDDDLAAIIRISKKGDSDAINAFAQVTTVLDAERSRFPKPFSITVINDTTQNIQDRIDVVLGNTAVGLVLVFIVMCLYFSIREAFWISAALPVSFLAAFFVLSLLGVTINMISLIAMLMAVGLIMDDSIVIADNIAKWRRRAGPAAASVRGASEVMPGVLSSFLTTACVFTPLMFLTGEMGSILEVIPVVLLVVLAISVVEAFLILPNHLSHAADDHEKQARRIAPRITESVKDKFVLPVVKAFVAWRYLTLGLTFALLIATVGLIASGTVKVIGFPASEGDTIEARLTLTAGTPQSRTKATVDQLLRGLAQVNETYGPKASGGDDLVERVLVRYAVNADVAGNGSHTATITVDLQASEQRNVKANEVLLAWKAAAGLLTDVTQSNFTQTTTGPGGSDLDVILLARDLDQLEAASEALFEKLIARDDVTDAYQDFSGGQTEVALSLNPFGSSSGLTPQQLALQLRSAFSGNETDSFMEELTDLRVQVELSDSINGLSDLEAFPINLAGGGQVALNSVADIEISPSYTQITRQDGAAVARIIGKIDNDATTSAILSQLIRTQYGPEIAAAFPGVSVGIGGATEAQQETQSSIVISLLIGLIGVYLILAYQFRSYTLPIVVMLSIPFAIIGMVFGHLALGLDLSMPSFIGFASLAGIVVNNAILFVTFFEMETKEGNYITAAVEAVSHRFRPILLSFTTTFVGLLPIVFETSPQAQTMIPLVTSVAFGLLSSTLLVVFVLPAALAIYFDFFSIHKWLATRDALNATDQAVTES